MRALLLLALLAPVAAAASVEGTLSFSQGARLDADDARIYADLGAIDLAGAASGMSLAWGSATGYLVTAGREAAGVPGAYSVFVGDPETDNETLTFGAGELRDLRCEGECSALLFSDGAGALSVAGAIGGSFAPSVEEVVFAARGSDGPMPDGFYYPIPAGSFAAGAGSSALPVEGARWEASGALGLFLENATAEVVTQEGSTEIFAMHTSEDSQGALATPATRRVVVRFAVIHAEGALLALPQGAPATLYAPAPVVEAIDKLSAAGVSGTLVVDGEPRELDGASLNAIGDLRATLLPAGAGALPIADAPMRSELGGEASTILVDNAPVARASASPATKAGVGIGIAVLLLAAGAALYTRLDRSNVLRNPNRLRVYETLRQTPGLGVRHLARETGLAEVVVRHHLRMLQQQSHVVARGELRDKVFFAADGAVHPEAVKVAVALKDVTRRRIASALAASAIPLSQKEITVAVGASQRLVSHHLMRLEADGLVQTSGSWPRRYAATPQLAATLGAASEAIVPSAA